MASTSARLPVFDPNRTPQRTATTLKLRPRERQIVALLLEGKTIQKIADELSLARGTVYGYLTAINTRHGLTSRDALLRAVKELFAH